jgi:hypothetical protein
VDGFPSNLIVNVSPVFTVTVVPLSFAVNAELQPAVEKTIAKSMMVNSVI